MDSSIQRRIESRRSSPASSRVLRADGDRHREHAEHPPPTGTERGLAVLTDRTNVPLVVADVALQDRHHGHLLDGDVVPLALVYARRQVDGQQSGEVLGLLPGRDGDIGDAFGRATDRVRIERGEPVRRVGLVGDGEDVGGADWRGGRCSRSSLRARRPTRSSARRGGKPTGRPAGVGRISNVCGARRVANTPGLGTFTKVRLRCASLSEIDGSAPGGMTSGSNAISAIRHWCWLRTSC